MARTAQTNKQKAENAFADCSIKEMTSLLTKELPDILKWKVRFTGPATVEVSPSKESQQSQQEAAQAMLQDMHAGAED
jgi:hypothetical protein